MKLFVLIISLSILGFTKAQNGKITMKKEVVSVDNTPVFKLISTQFPRTVTLYNLQDQILAVFETKVLYDVKDITKANPDGRIPYFEVTFNDSIGSKCEFDPYPIKKHIAMVIITENLVEDGHLVPEKVTKFCKAYKDSYTRAGIRRRGTPNPGN